MHTPENIYTHIHTCIHTYIHTYQHTYTYINILWSCQSVSLSISINDFSVWCQRRVRSVPAQSTAPLWPESTDSHNTRRGFFPGFFFTGLLDAPFFFFACRLQTMTVPLRQALQNGCGWTYCSFISLYIRYIYITIYALDGEGSNIIFPHSHTYNTSPQTPSPPPPIAIIGHDPHGISQSILTPVTVPVTVTP